MLRSTGCSTGWVVRAAVQYYTGLYRRRIGKRQVHRLIDSVGLGESRRRIGTTFRIQDGDLGTLGLTVLYALTLSLLFYMLAVAALRRRRFI